MVAGCVRVRTSLKCIEGLHGEYVEQLMKLNNPLHLYETGRLN